MPAEAGDPSASEGAPRAAADAVPIRGTVTGQDGGVVEKTVVLDTIRH
ncbi:hypothetical protein [Paractinoplanes globisporus]|uniref:Uncharacterized protein n=1 Tax=Paractinoplanes globisporus TaxID=113565 RepID=A0ABW6WP41_9ACTN|nr:hypothetical protein [Actinoplanes globisporus]